MASEFKLEVGQDEGNASHVFYVQCGVPLDRKTLQVVGLLLDGGYGPGEIEPLADVAAVYVSVTEMQDDINVTNATGKTPSELAGEVESLAARVEVLERERDSLLSALNEYCAAESMPTTAPGVELTEREHTYSGEFGGGECSKYGRWYGICHSCNREREELQARANHVARLKRDEALSVASRTLRTLLARVNQPAAVTN